MPAAARKFESPFPVSPSGGKPGRAGSPQPRTLRASPTRWHASMRRLPPQEGFQSAPLKPPLRIPPAGFGQSGWMSAAHETFGFRESS